MLHEAGTEKGGWSTVINKMNGDTGWGSGTQGAREMQVRGSLITPLSKCSSAPQVSSWFYSILAGPQILGIAAAKGK